MVTIADLSASPEEALAVAAELAAFVPVLSVSEPWIQSGGSVLAQVAEYLSGTSPDTGSYSQLLLADVATRYQHLLGALDEELRRRQQPEQEEGGEDQQAQQQGNHAPQRLVPPVAELLLLKGLEEELLVDLRTFRAAAREGLDEATRATQGRILERLGHRHREMTELFDELLSQAGVQLEDIDGDEN